MIDRIDRLLQSPKVAKYRKALTYVAICLLIFHLIAFILRLVFPERPRAAHLVSTSEDLFGVTGALLLLVILDQGIQAMSGVEKRRRREVYSDIKERIRSWFGNVYKKEGDEFVNQVVDDVSYTDLKVKGQLSLIDQVPSSIAEQYCEQIHFEFTFYPTKIIYGIHFESPWPSVNEAMFQCIRSELQLDDDTGFIRDREIPKKPGWIFLIRTVQAAEALESDHAVIMTHARHFVELVGHSYNIIYSNEMAEQFASVLSEINAT